MDVLSEVLRAVRLDGALFFNAEFSAPWCLSEPRSKAVAHQFSAKSGHLILYHFLIQGHAFARLADGRQEDLEAGDVVIFPQGDDHLLGYGAPEKPVDAVTAFAENLKDGLKLVRFGGGGEVTRMICGYMICDPKLSEVFLAGLPKMLKVHITGEGSDQWIENSIRYFVAEGDSRKEGSDVVVAKLSEVLFVETLRRYINSLPPEEKGWLAGARDPVIGKAIALIHSEPTHQWTISDLARRVGTSRTRFAERFKHFLDESPIAYLAKWRLKLGAEILNTTEDSVAAIAASVGYGSESTFNRAFKKEFGFPPAQFRRRARQEIM
jgi:AraC-like DNA-binding protein